MNIELVVVGAHNGNKLFRVIEQAANKGIVILIEPVEWLFNQLIENVCNLKNVICINKAVVAKEKIKEVTFNAPKQNANSFNTVADQLGSLILNHANNSVAGIDFYFEQVTVPATTFKKLLKDFGITRINSLITDTEGMDAVLLSSFPFNKITPHEILFEYKHADGTMRVGKNLANLLIRLTDLEYVIIPVDHENFYAIKQ